MPNFLNCNKVRSRYSSLFEAVCGLSLCFPGFVLIIKSKF